MTRIFLAGSGLLLVFFLVIHLTGIVLAVIAPLTFELYASELHTALWVNVLELFLTATVLVHIFLTLQKVFQNSQTGNTSDLVSRRKDFLAVLAARSQLIGGIILLYFLWIHLGQLRFPRPPDGEELYTIRLVLSSSKNSIIYVIGSLTLFFHLLHGIESSQRSLGIITDENAFLIRVLGRGLSLLISAGFALATIALTRSSFLIN